MKNYKKIIVGSLMTALIIASPLATFAKGNNKNENNDRNNKGKQEQSREENKGKDVTEFKKTKNTVAPVISDLTVTSVKKNKATLNWTTDTKSNTLVWFSTVSPVDTTLKQNNSRKAKVLNHKIEIKKLEANTKYYLIVGSTNKIGLTKSVETSFTTLAKINEGNHVITSLSGPTTIVAGETATVTINAYNHENESLSYSADWNDTNIIAENALNAVGQPVFVQTSTLSHIYSNAGVYTATFTVKNEEGKTATSTLKITVTPVEH